MISEANRTCRECGETDIVCELLGSNAGASTGTISFSHSCGCKKSTKISTQDPDMSAFICSLCGYDHGLDIVRESPYIKMAWITRLFIGILGLIFFATGEPLFSQDNPSTSAILFYGTSLLISAVVFYWAVRGEIVVSSFGWLVRVAPLMGLVGCAAKTAGLLLVFVLLVGIFFRSLFETMAGLF